MQTVEGAWLQGSHTAFHLRQISTPLTPLACVDEYAHSIEEKSTMAKRLTKLSYPFSHPGGACISYLAFTSLKILKSFITTYVQCFLTLNLQAERASFVLLI